MLPFYPAWGKLLQKGDNVRLPWWSSGRERTQVPSLDREDPLEKVMATHSSILAWRIPWTEEPGGATAHRIAKESDTT